MNDDRIYDDERKRSIYVRCYGFVSVVSMVVLNYYYMRSIASNVEWNDTRKTSIDWAANTYCTYWNEVRHFIADAHDGFLFPFAVVNELGTTISAYFWRHLMPCHAFDSVVIHRDDDVGCVGQAFFTALRLLQRIFCGLLTPVSTLAFYLPAPIPRLGVSHSYNRILCDNTAFLLQSRPLEVDGVKSAIRFVVLMETILPATHV